MNSESKGSSGAPYRGATGYDTNESGSKVLSGALVGAVAGSIVGGLFTSEKGIETRRRLGEGSRNMASNVKDKFSDITEGLADKYEAAKEGAADLIEKGKQKVGMSPGDTAYKRTTGAGANDSGSILLGALVGAVAGSIIWGLFATEKGIETRKRIGESSRNMANDLKDKFSDITEGIADKYEAAKEGAADLIEKGKEKVGMSSGSTAYRGSAGADVL